MDRDALYKHLQHNLSAACQCIDLQHGSEPCASTSTGYRKVDGVTLPRSGSPTRARTANKPVITHTWSMIARGCRLAMDKCTILMVVRASPYRGRLPVQSWTTSSTQAPVLAS